MKNMTRNIYIDIIGVKVRFFDTMQMNGSILSVYLWADNVIKQKYLRSIPCGKTVANSKLVPMGMCYYHT